ncbi:RDD family protein [Actinomadura algeriensis]|uniref:RDD family membrane protein YckC n=1 Tax=Actinomadura algeriensis TaxID=1679523 RepID=A0ABR9JUN6_9ACTN|nr:RDD family protein [Actinomadura algeriensis]MBE1534119.1 putative RDD family membrane protein YckC [Actinomadura algeriensis]
MTHRPNDPGSGGEPEDWPPPEQRPHGQGQGQEPPPPERPGEPRPGRSGQPGHPGYPGQEQPGYGEQPPPYPGSYGGGPYGGQQYGGLPGYGGGPDEYVDPSAGLASRWARLAAGIIDLVVLSIISGLISLPFVDWGSVVDPEPGEYAYDGVQVWTNLIAIIVGFLYFWLMHAKWGQTLGKMLLRIRVVRADDGGPVVTSQAAARSAFYSVLGGVCGCIGFIDVLWILWDPRRQALHDKIARTVVVKADPHMPNPYNLR